MSGDPSAPVSGLHRPKQPEQIRRALLDCTRRIAVEDGALAITVQRVASAAGVTKGGLFHHFPSKQALIEGVFADLLEELGRSIDVLMAADPTPHGRFTRAYIDSVLAEESGGPESVWRALSATMLADPALRGQWASWIAARQQAHHATDSGPELQLLRLAADGAWLSLMLEAGRDIDLPALREHLHRMSRG